MKLEVLVPLVLILFLMAPHRARTSPSTRLSVLREMAQVHLKEFDQMLDRLLTEDQGAEDYLQSPAYLRLLVTRHLIEEATHDQMLSLRRSSRQEVQREVEALVQERVARKWPSPGFKKVHPDPGPAGSLTGTEFTPGRFSLTFDDGPSPRYTAPLVALLNEFDLPATFFWLARNTIRYPQSVQVAKAAAMEIGNHSYKHPLLTKLRGAALAHEIVDAQKVITKVLGFPPQTFRCPYGGCGEDGSSIRTLIAEQKMVEVFWNIDSADWQDHNPDSVYQRVKKQMALSKHGIILFHDIQPHTVEACRKLFADLRDGIEKGTHRVLTVNTAIAELNSQGGMK